MRGGAGTGILTAVAVAAAAGERRAASGGLRGGGRSWAGFGIRGRWIDGGGRDQTAVGIGTGTDKRSHAAATVPRDLPARLPACCVCEPFGSATTWRWLWTRTREPECPIIIIKLKSKI
jgi:hypothetical protein